ncbi:Ig-like domain-containing protein [Lunatibacter salilacus]|uniref:Ig-like domain-containing protein n=1 Tax=Lunatibacter salilacus TaxID=2483804 RepID=UPI00131A8C5B|nr:Ig-like domain-containing protein [Lunatibacter salilacus]
MKLFLLRSILLIKARRLSDPTELRFYSRKALSFLLLFFTIFFTSCPDSEPDDPIDQDETKDQLAELVLITTEEEMQDDWLPDDYDLSNWYEYWEKNNTPPRIEGKLIEFTVTVNVQDGEGNPVKDANINFSPEAGAITPSTAKSGSDGTVTALWKFDGSWETWGNWDLTINGFTPDGEKPLDGSPIIVQAVITAPPGV